MRTEPDKICKTCNHYLSAELIGMVCMNVHSDRFGNGVKSMDGCQSHRIKAKRAAVKKMSDKVSVCPGAKVI
jgi:hypothetical protein